MQLGMVSYLQCGEYHSILGEIKMQLIPTIKIGKKYLCKIVIQERSCTGCGHIFGSKTVGKERIVTVLMETPFFVTCPECGEWNTGNQGYYGVIDETGKHWAVPYTQLEEIGDEDGREE